MEPTTLIFRIVLAAFLGGLIGLERDIHGRAAGLRTNLLVGMGAAIFMIVSQLIASPDPSGGITADPGRIAAQIVTGIGFLGAGTIIKEGVTIRGLTTAACLWTVAGVGMAAGGGYYTVAVFATIISLSALLGLLYIEKLYPKQSFGTLTIMTTNDIDASIINTTIKDIKSMALKIISLNLERNYETEIAKARISLRFSRKEFSEMFTDNIIKSFEQSAIPIKSISWEHQ